MEALTREQARRIAVRAQLLDARRPESVLDVIQRLGFLQYDLTRAVAPSQDVILWSRLGEEYDPAELQDLRDTQELIELHMVIRPASDVALYAAEMAAWPTPGTWEQRVADWATSNAACAQDILDLLRSDGPLPTTQLPDTCVVPWRSSGWTHDKNVQKILSALVARGEVALSRREGAMPWWDLAERVYPDVPPVPLAEAARERNGRRLAALGIARAKTVQTPVEPNDVGPVGIQATVEGVRGTWQVDPAQLDRVDEAFEGRAALLSPLDRLVFDRKRLAEIFEYDYALEMYKPAAQRIWGYWALPVLYGDRLIGKVDAIAEREEGELIVRALYEDEPWSPSTRADVVDELESLARWLDLALVLP
ncbi:MAG TPA: crosslink repair DNA glycosylase YcaQ family protein [Propionibacteriaceae bacterium]